MKDYKLTLVKNECIAQEIYALTLSGLDDEFYNTFVPGQFAHVAVPKAPQHLLRRPISIASVDRTAGTMMLCCAVVGEGTRLLCDAKPGDALEAIAPIGHGYPIDANLKKIYFLGGGMGVAPMLSAAELFKDRNCTAFLGWRDRAHAYAADDFARTGCAVEPFTDDGSAFVKGFALEGLLARLASGKHPDAVFACGPLPMLKALKRKLPNGVPCFVSLEERMGCGVGGCLTCTCKINVQNGTENQRVCVDGPVFSLSEVNFDD